jgi:hypothetical protein
VTGSFSTDGLAGRQTAERVSSEQSGGPLKLRGKDSNLDYLIQSQASYH